MSSVSNEISGVSLEYVARAIEGDISTNTVEYSPSEKANVRKEKTLTDPVIVFFASGNVQVFSGSRAEELGFLQMPNIMNISTVQDNNTPAGRYKNAIQAEQRNAAWMDLEKALILKCTQKTGHPLDVTTKYSQKSLYLN